MTDEIGDAAPIVERDEPTSDSDSLSFARPDNELEMLVNLANDVGLSMSITLTTTGGVVSGDLCGFRDFWNKTADGIERSAWGDDVAEAAAKAIAEAYRKRATNFGLEDDQDDDGEQTYWPPRYIHLKSARFHDGHQYVAAGLWRGRLTQVAGWAFGRAE